MTNLLLAYYGDDFTGSTDALEFLSRAGASTVLFIEPPTAADLAQYPGLNAYGIAGITRSLDPERMEKTLQPAFELMKQSGAQHIHYKTCSTFDSSPAIGSIGMAIDTAADIFNNGLIPLLVAAPVLGRYCLFGNLFARMGIGSAGDIFRLDRHPSMRQHPVTPSTESDLRLHLGKQTHKTIGLIDILQQEKGIGQWNEKNEHTEIILLDALYDAQLLRIGEWLEAQREPGKPLFSVGSSGIEMALGKWWNNQQVLPPVSEWPHPGKASKLLVVSGSCSPVTAAQIAWAGLHGFTIMEIDVTAINGEETPSLDDCCNQAESILQNGQNLVIHTGAKKADQLSSQKLGTALGNLAKQLVTRLQLQRVIIAGGDTSSYAARAMEIVAVEMLAPLVSGAPLCRAISANEGINGLEINFKGGQVGGEDYFEVVLNGELKPARG